MRGAATTISFLALCLFLISMSACKSVKDFKEDRAELLEERKERKKDKKDEKGERIALEGEDVVIEEANAVEGVVFEKKDSLYLSYERTACFGRCPIYKFKVYDSGFATYEGINFVEKMGVFHTRVSEDKLIAIETKLNDTYFFQLEDEYDNENLMDLPSKIIKVNKPTVSKRIKARHQVPDELKDLFKYIDEVIDGLSWKAGDGQ